MEKVAYTSAFLCITLQITLMIWDFIDGAIKGYHNPHLADEIIQADHIRNPFCTFSYFRLGAAIVKDTAAVAAAIAWILS